MRNDYHSSQNNLKICRNALTSVSFTDMRIGNESGDEIVSASDRDRTVSHCAKRLCAQKIVVTRKEENERRCVCRRELNLTP